MTRSGDRFSTSLYYKRRLVNLIALCTCFFSVFFGLVWLTWILMTLVSHGGKALSLSLFMELTPPPGEKGGLLNAIVGSMMMNGLATVIGTPVGILAGTYLSEYGAQSFLASLVRFSSHILLSAPSIVIGYFIYAIVVHPAHHFSGWAGTLALAVIVIPIIVNTTEGVLKLVPSSLREAAAALGAPRWRVILSITWRASRSGILTGVLLAIARISGETAPLLFTALNSQFFSAKLSEEMANLPVSIFQFAMSPYESWQNLAWGGALLITIAILLTNIGTRFFFKKR